MPKMSAGILLYRRSGDDVEVLLVHPGGPFWAKKDLGAWSIPKGEYDQGDDPLETALRELEEETGHRLGDQDLLELGTIRQRSGKVLSAWAAAPPNALAASASGAVEAPSLEAGTLPSATRVTSRYMPTTPISASRMARGRLRSGWRTSSPPAATMSKPPSERSWSCRRWPGCRRAPTGRRQPRPCSRCCVRSATGWSRTPSGACASVVAETRVRRRPSSGVPQAPSSSSSSSGRWSTRSAGESGP